MKFIFSICVLFFSLSLYSADSLYSAKRSHSVKTDLLSLTGDRVSMSYEYKGRLNAAFVAGFDVLGVGRRYGVLTQTGVTGNLAYRQYLKSNPQVNTSNHKGLYLQIGVIGGQTSGKSFVTPKNYPDESNLQPSYRNVKYTTVAGLASIGAEFRLKGRFLIDLYGGLGFGKIKANSFYNSDFDSTSEKIIVKNPTWRQSIIVTGSDMPFVFSAGIKLGYQLK